MTDVVEVMATPAPVVQVTGNLLTGLVEVTTMAGTIVDLPDTEIDVLDVVTAGPSGPRGPQGDKGETGLQGPSPLFEQQFNIAAATWVITHPLNTYPAVTTVDLNGEEIIGDLSYPDRNTVVVVFGMPFAGTALLKA